MARASFTRRLLSIALGLFATVALAGLASAPATAQVDPAKLPAAKAAAATLTTLAQGSATRGQMPRDSDPAVRRLLDAVFDASDVAAGRPVAFQELTPLSERMVTGARIGTVYMLAGTGATDLAALANDPKADEKVNLNVIKFAPEMGRFFDFELRIQGAIVDAVLARLGSVRPDEAARPNFQSGIASIRQGSQRTVASVIETLAVNGLTEEWRRDRLPALTAIAPKLGKFLLPDQKADLQTLAVACADVMEDAQVKQSLQAFARTVGGG